MLEEKVGRGGFGSVYRAWDPVLEMAVALKILHQRYSDDRLKERLLHEGRALAQLRHPNVVRVLNVEQHGGRLGLVMEFLSGETMDALVAAHGNLSDREASVIVEDVCRALAAVHANGLIHRDVKARNIIRESAGRIVLMDFGAGLSVRTTEAPGTAVGTPLYMAPEMLNGAPATPASDVYGVGVLLFYLVSGRYPYEGGSFDEIRDAHTARRANSLLALRPDLPVRFVNVVDRALALDVAERYQTPDALLQALADLSGAVSRGRWAWVRPALYAGTALLALMAVGGMLSSVAYNAALGRAAYQSDTFVQKFGWGAQALFLPIVLTCLAAGLAGAIVAVRRVLIASSTRVGALDRRVEERGRNIAVRLTLTDPAVCMSWLLLVTSACAAAIWIYWTPLLLAVTTDISSAPAQMLEVFSPALAPYRTGYRMALSLLVAGNLAGWFLLRRATGARSPLPASDLRDGSVADRPAPHVDAAAVPASAPRRDGRCRHLARATVLRGGRRAERRSAVLLAAGPPHAYRAAHQRSPAAVEPEGASVRALLGARPVTSGLHHRSPLLEASCVDSPWSVRSRCWRCACLRCRPTPISGSGWTA